MRNRELISIIVPVYNVEKYLRKCLDSIVNQIYKDLEIFLINDGSTDGSLAICQEYKEKDNRITIFNQEHLGPSSARNLGLDNARGNFISFIDSDDYIAPNFISELYFLLKDTGSDIVQCDYLRVEEDDTNSIFSKKSLLKIEQYTGCEYLQKLYSKKFSPRNIVVWNKLYCRSIWDNTRFPIGMLNEDEAIIHHIYDKINKITITSEIHYFYLKRAGSIMNLPLDLTIKRDLYYWEVLTERLNFFELKGYVELKNETLAHKAIHLRGLYKKNKRLNSSLFNCNPLIYSDLESNLKLYLRNKDIKLKLKIRLLIFYIKLKNKQNSVHP